MPSRPSGLRLPQTHERQLLERLTLLDLEGAADPREEISRFLGRVGRAELKGASFYAFDLLSTVNRLVWRGASEEGRRTDNRAALIATFSRISTTAELRTAFDEHFARMLAPFQGGAAGQHPAIARSKAFIHESYYRKISLREVAAHLGLSRTYLSTLFRRECGFTLTESLHRVRLQRAQELLRDGGSTLSAVASRVGYQNYRDFHRNFVRYRSLSPKRFRRELELGGRIPGSPGGK